MMRLFLLVVAAALATTFTCDFSQCQEHSHGRRDGDCCSTDSDVYCPSGSIITKVQKSRNDVTWINAPAGIPQTPEVL